MPNLRVYVCGLPKNTSETTLLEFANRFGKVRQVKIVLGRSRRSASFGMIIFAHQKSAENLLTEGTVSFAGQRCKIQNTNLTKRALARAKEQENVGKKVYIGGFNKTLTEGIIKSLFEQFGPVEKVVINRDHSTKESRGSGFIYFEQEEVATYVSESKIEELGRYRIIVLSCTKRFNSSKLIESKQALSTTCSLNTSGSSQSKPVNLVSPTHHESNLRFNFCRSSVPQSRYGMLPYLKLESHTSTSSSYLYSDSQSF